MEATVVIATAHRPQDLREVLEDWRAGNKLPIEVRVIDASDDTATECICNQDWTPLRVTYMRSAVKSAAEQRNLGASGCTSNLIVFCDDDIRVPKDALPLLIEVFESDAAERIGGIAGTIIGLHHPVPGRLLRLYYQLQAGYRHEHYGGQFFGAAINTLPTDRAQDPQLYPSQWLNSTLVAYRTAIFHRERFPSFAGYSFSEDVNLSARVGRTHELYFHRGIRFIHKNSPGRHKSDVRSLAAMRMTNRWYNATHLLGLSGSRRWWRFCLSLTFDSLLLLLRRPARWREQLRGSWSAWWELAIFGHRTP